MILDLLVMYDWLNVCLIDTIRTAVRYTTTVVVPLAPQVPFICQAAAAAAAAAVLPWSSGYRRHTAGRINSKI